MNRHLRVLIVEDIAEQREALRGMLAPDQELEIVCVARLAEARARVRRERFDVILLDLFLPDADDLEAFETLRREDDEVAIVIITGHPDPTLEACALERGAQDFLLKPKSAEELREAIRKAAIRRAEVRREVAVALQPMEDSLKSTGREIDAFQKLAQREKEHLAACQEKKTV